MCKTDEIWETIVQFGFDKTSVENYLEYFEKHPAIFGKMVLDKLKDNYIKG